MITDEVKHHEDLVREWTDQYVEVNSEKPELTRFAGRVGRVITVNWNNKAVIDFQDGAWYDIAPSEDCLKKLDPAQAMAKYDPKNNSNLAFPEKQS